MARRFPSDRSCALIVFAVALVARAAFVWSVGDTPSVRYAMGDAEAYHERALEILAGRWLDDSAFYQDPLYPYFLAAAYAVFGVGHAGVLWLQALLGAITATLVFAIGRRIFGTPSGLLAGLLAASYAPAIYFDALRLKVSVSLCLVTAALVLLLRAEARTRARAAAAWLAAGIAFGLATLTRGNYLLFLPLLLAWIAWGRAGGPRRLGAAVWVLAGIVLAIAPATLHNALVSREFVLITAQAGQNFYIGNQRANDNGAFKAPAFARSNPRHEQNDMTREAERRAGRPLSPSERSEFWFREGLAEIRADPAHAVELLQKKLRLLAADDEVPDNYDFGYFRSELAPALRWLPSWGWVAPLAAWGAILGRRDRRVRLLLLYLASYCASIALFYMGSRYRMPLVPVVLVLAGAGATQVSAALAQRRWRAAIPALAVLVAGSAIAHRPAIPRDDFALYRQKLGVHHARRAEDARARAAELARTGDAAAAARARALDAELSELAERELARALRSRPGNASIQRALLRQGSARVRGLLERGEAQKARSVALRLAHALPDRAAPQVLLDEVQAQLDSGP